MNIHTGQWVRVNTVGCHLECANGHEETHRRYNGMHGVAEGDIREYCENHVIRCRECFDFRMAQEFFERTGHYIQVCFEGNHAVFDASELEPFDLDAEVKEALEMAEVKG